MKIISSKKEEELNKHICLTIMDWAKTHATIEETLHTLEFYSRKSSDGTCLTYETWSITQVINWLKEVEELIREPIHPISIINSQKKPCV